MTSLLDAKAIGIAGRLAPTDLLVEAGQMVAVIGPNGGGKTSLLRALARTEDALGTVTIDGRGRRPERRGAAPPPARLPARVARRYLAGGGGDFLSLGLSSPDPARIAQLVELLELAALASRPIDQLSTGERARAMLGRAIAAGPRLLLLDEPLSNLDPYWVLRTVEIVRAEIASNDSAALVSVHDLDMARRFDRLLLVSGGAVIADGDPAKVLGQRSFEQAFRVSQSERGWAIS